MVGTSAHLGMWSLALTLIQAGVFSLSSRDDPRGWAGGLGLQPPWVTYAWLSHQPAFMLTSVIIALANLGALRRHRGRPAAEPLHRASSAGTT